MFEDVSTLGDEPIPPVLSSSFFFAISDIGQVFWPEIFGQEEHRKRFTRFCRCHQCTAPKLAELARKMGLDERLGITPHYDSLKIRGDGLRLRIKMSLYGSLEAVVVELDAGRDLGTETEEDFRGRGHVKLFYGNPFDDTHRQVRPEVAQPLGAGCLDGIRPPDLGERLKPWLKSHGIALPHHEPALTR